MTEGPRLSPARVALRVAHRLELADARRAPEGHRAHALAVAATVPPRVVVGGRVRQVEPRRESHRCLHL